MLSRWYACDEHRKSLSDIGWREHHIIFYDMIALEKHDYTATRAERIQILENWILAAQMLKEELSHHSINDPTVLKRKENANDCMTSTWQRTQQEYRDIPRSQRQQYEGHEDLDYVVDPNTGWRLH